MRLFHVSEEADIKIFNPRKPDRDDLDKNIKLIWAIDENRLPNFLTPRNCPRITYHIGKATIDNDIYKYFPSKKFTHVVIIENQWLNALNNTTLYLYEFDAKNFELQDEIAGYYVSKVPQKPISKHKIDNLQKALSDRNTELKTVDNLWSVADEIKSTTLNYSFCRMQYAQPRKQTHEGM